jgi:hypothetical protein
MVRLDRVAQGALVTDVEIVALLGLLVVAWVLCGGEDDGDC